MVNDNMSKLSWLIPKENQALQVEKRLLFRDNFICLLDTEKVISESIVDAYLSRGEKDCHDDPACPTHSLYILETRVSKIIASQKMTSIFKPKQSLGFRTFWIPEINVFEQELVLVPLYYTPNRCWLLIEIRPVTNIIRLYDPTQHERTRSHVTIAKHIIRFLQYEYSVRHPGLCLPNFYTENFEIIFQARLHNLSEPREHNNILIAILCKVLCYGKSVSNISTTLEELQEAREQIATHLYLGSSDKALPENVDQLRTRRHIYSRNEQLECFSVEAESCQDIENYNSLNVPQNISAMLWTPKVSQWGMWPGPPNHTLVYPGRIVEISKSTQTVLIEIPDSLISQAPHAPICFKKTWKDVRAELEFNTFEYPWSKIAPLRWPAILDDSFLMRILENYGPNDEPPFDAHLSTDKREILNYLRNQLPTVRRILLGTDPVLSGLCEEWKNSAQTSGDSFGQGAIHFVESRLSYLDKHDQCIIRHLAIWEIVEKTRSTVELRYIDAVGCSILAYMCIGLYLKKSPTEVYLLDVAKQLHRPLSIHEEAWNVIITYARPLLPRQYGIRLKSHRILDTKLSLPPLDILLLPGYPAT